MKAMDKGETLHKGERVPNETYRDPVRKHEMRLEFYSDSRAGDVRFRSIDFRLRPAGVPQGGWCHKGCQNIAILMRISDMYSNLP